MRIQGSELPAQAAVVATLGRTHTALRVHTPLLHHTQRVPDRHPQVAGPRFSSVLVGQNMDLFQTTEELLLTPADVLRYWALMSLWTASYARGSLR